MPATRIDHVSVETGASPRSPTRRAIFSLPLLLAPLWAADAYAATKVTAARVWPANEYTRVTFESAVALKIQHFFVKDPERLVIDIENVDLGPALRELAGKVGANDPFIQAVRVGINRTNVIRVVLDLRTEVTPQVFAVPPIGDFGHRLMLDIYPTKPADPMLALLRDDLADFGKGNSANVAVPATPAPSPEAVPPTVTAEAPSAPPMVASGKKVPRPIVIVLDPGHGGEDPGAVGRRGTREKDIVLVIAKLLRARLHDDQKFRIALTRDADFFVPLEQRVQRARQLRSDLLVSIHADAFVHPDANGSSVFALSERGATSTAAKWLANRENEADLIGGVNIGMKDGFLARTLLDLSQTAQINDSLKLGRLVLTELGGVNRLHKMNVEQAGFAVLKAPDIPSILIETAFISNPQEEKKLRDPKYQTKMAHAIADGIKRYFAKNPPMARA